MEEGRQKSNSLSYTAKFHRYSVRREGKPQSRCNFWSWWKQHSTVAETQGSERWVWSITKEIHWIQERTISWNWWCSLHVFFQERRRTGLFVNDDLLRKQAIKNARSLTILQCRFKASKGWTIRFMRWMGLVLRHRTICQKLPKDFEQKLLNYQRHIIFPKSSSRPRI
jgi:hypothetical protein